MTRNCSLQAERYAAGVRRFDFDAGMAPYDLASYGNWQALTGHITPVSAPPFGRWWNTMCSSAINAYPGISSVRDECIAV